MPKLPFCVVYCPMPELPEVETICQSLKPVLTGKHINRALVRSKALRHDLDCNLFSPILKKRILSVRRRAKYIVIAFKNKRFMVIHLGMTGSFRLVKASEPYLKHEHIIWRLNTHDELRFNDPRRFGSVTVCAANMKTGEPACLPLLGPEPLSRAFNPYYLFQQTRKRTSLVKSFLLDQRRIAGIGNIYASEALHRAGILPIRKSGSLTVTECRQLTKAIKTVLGRAVKAGGTTLHDFKHLDGTAGFFKVKLLAYEQDDKPCRTCGQAAIRRTVIGGRSTYFCPMCQI